jgi:transcriptional regulator with XRE-family HTH domain
MAVKPSHFASNRQQPASSPLQLSSLAGYQRFGEYLRVKRQQFGLTQTEMSEQFPTLTGQTYGYLERERRAPQVDELVPLFTVLVELHSDMRLPPMQVIEAQTFFRLGKTIIEKKQRKRQRVTKEQWDAIEQQLIKMVDSPQGSSLRLVAESPTTLLVLESPDSRRRKALEEAMNTDVEALLEREEWVKKALSRSDRTLPLKISITQGGMGAGKSHALALLIRRLSEREDLFLIPYRFEHSETKTPDDHLDIFLATVYADLTLRATDEMKQHPLAQRIEQTLTVLRSFTQKVVFLLDDGQEMFPSANEWSAGWHQFFDMFIGESHKATMYLMTRTWPGWDKRKRFFLEEEDLPELTLEAGVLLWEHLGFDDVDKMLLRNVCRRCGTNPQIIEMLAFQYKRRSFSIALGKETSYSAQENPHTRSLKKLLANETLFSGYLDATSRRTLQQVFSNRLSGETMQILECLALSPLGVPFDLLVNRFDYGAESFEDLVKASFADLAMAASYRAALVPLVREAVIQSLTPARKAEMEELVTELYASWLTTSQDFRDDAEKAALIAEMVVRYIRSRQLLESAKLFVGFGWLCALFGQVARIQRVFDEVVKADRGKEENVQHEVGRLLFLYHFSRVMRKSVDPHARDAAFHWIYNLEIEGRIILDPRLEIYVAHTLIDRMVHETHYQEAYNFLQDTFHRITQAQKISSEVLASFLHNKAYLLGRWSRQTSDSNESICLTQECVNVLYEVVEMLRDCLKNALPLQERYYEFKLARVLNDLAYYARRLNRYGEAEQAIKKCLFIKDEKKGDSPSSLALSLSEYAQIILPQGRFHEADEKSCRALQLLDQALQSGDSSVAVDKGRLLVEQAHVFEMQGRILEEKQALQEALGLLPDVRDNFRIGAEQRLARIQVIEESSLKYQLDNHWYQRYLPIAQFDDLALLAQSGPFTDDEKRDWDRLYPKRNDAAVRKHLEEIIGQSKEREFKQSIAEDRLPRIQYPAIDIEDVLTRIRDFSTLKDDIAQKETNIVVRRLYVSKIEEQLLILRSIEATHRRDIGTLHSCNEALFGRIGKAEMEIALRELFQMLKRAQKHHQSTEVAEQLLRQLKQWNLSAEDFLSNENTLGERIIPEKLQKWRETPVSSQAVRQFYEEIIKTYGFGEWRVVLSSDRDIVSLNLERCEMYLPTSRRFSVLTAAELLAEEIETHIFRAVAGKRSKVALLGSGTRGFLPTEEGFARVTVQEMLEVQGLGRKDYAWITTLAPGLASGVLTPAQSFRTLYEFLKKAFLASNRYDTTYDAKIAALSRASRTFGGIPDLEVVGICNLQDRVYLQGYREVTDALQGYPKERLLVGSIGIADLNDMEELHMLQPVIKHQQLAHDPQLFERIIALEK